MKIVSACLVGINCKFNGKSNSNKKLIEMFKKGELIPLCPEQLGGLPTPREPCGIYGGIGEDVLAGRATVRTARGEGKNLTKFFVKGAEKVLDIIKGKKIKVAILKEGSPSCGCKRTWQVDDNFRNHKVDGAGVVTALLRKNGIKVITEEEFL